MREGGPISYVWIFPARDLVWLNLSLPCFPEAGSELIGEYTQDAGQGEVQPVHWEVNSGSRAGG